MRSWGFDGWPPPGPDASCKTTTQGAPRRDRHYISGPTGGARGSSVAPQHRATGREAALEGRNDARTGMPGRLLPGAMCVQRFDGSLNSAIHITYRISLRSSSMPEPRDPLLKVLTCFFFVNQNIQSAVQIEFVALPAGTGGRGTSAGRGDPPPDRLPPRQRGKR